jgi:hypothetical protein
MGSLLRMTLVVFSAAACLAIGADRGRAQDKRGGDLDPRAEFAGTRWYLTIAEREAAEDCDSGYMTFYFDKTGYFMFNRRMRGSWRIDELGNIRLRTRDGLNLILLVQEEALAPASNAGFMRRRDVYKRCRVAGEPTD